MFKHLTLYLSLFFAISDKDSLMYLSHVLLMNNIAQALLFARYLARWSSFNILLMFQNLETLYTLALGWPHTKTSLFYSLNALLSSFLSPLLCTLVTLRKSLCSSNSLLHLFVAHCLARSALHSRCWEGSIRGWTASLWCCTLPLCLSIRLIGFFNSNNYYSLSLNNG